MQYMLDTDICSHVIRRRDPRLLAVLQTRTRSGAVVCVSAITYAELRLGALCSSSVRRHGEAIQALCDRLSGVLAWGKPRVVCSPGANPKRTLSHAFRQKCFQLADRSETTMQ